MKIEMEINLQKCCLNIELLEDLGSRGKFQCVRLKGKRVWKDIEISLNCLVARREFPVADSLPNQGYIVLLNRMQYATFEEARDWVILLLSLCFLQGIDTCAKGKVLVLSEKQPHPHLLFDWSRRGLNFSKVRAASDISVKTSIVNLNNLPHFISILKGGINHPIHLEKMLEL